MPEGNYRVNFITNAHYDEISSTYAKTMAGKTNELSTTITKETNFSLSYEINGNLRDRFSKLIISEQIYS